MHTVSARSILSAGNGMNLYRGCMHGCIYCDSRSVCYGMTHPFEDIEVKENAIALLESALRGKRRKGMISTGSMTDPYIPLEEELCYMRQALKLAEKYGFGFTLITKSSRVLRDIDLFARIHAKTKCVIQMTLTTYDEALCRKLEPNVSTTRERFEALCALRDAGIPTLVWLCPILPFINDTPENLQGILDYCIRADVRGIINFGMGMTLREGSREYFYSRLDRLFPGMKQRYAKAYGTQYILDSPRSHELLALFHQTCQAHGILHDNDRIYADLHAMPQRQHCRQMSLFDPL